MARIGSLLSKELVLNVKEFGAKGDGVTDDRVAFNAAINVASAEGGGIVYVPSGTYIVTGTGTASDGAIALKDNVTLQGEGIGNTIIKLKDQYTDADSTHKITGLIRTPSGVITRNAVIKDFTINGNRHQQTIAITSISVTSNVATITTTAAHGLTGTNTLYIEGADEDVINGHLSCTVTGASAMTYSVTSGDGSKTAVLEYLTRTALGKQAITSISVTSNVATVTTTVAHGLETGDQVIHIGCSEQVINGVKNITKTGASTYTFIVTSADGAKSAGLYFSGLHDGYFCGVTPSSAQKDTDIVVENVEVKSCSQYGLDPHEQTLRFTATGIVAFDNALDGCVADYLVESNYKNLHLYSNGRHGLNVVTTTTGLNIENIKTEANGWGNGGEHGSGLAIQQSSNIINVSGLISRFDFDNGLRLSDIQDLVASNLSIQFCGEHGILVEGVIRGNLTTISIYNPSQNTDNTFDGIVIKDASGTDSSEVTINGFDVISDATNKHRKALKEDINDATDCYYSNGVSVGNQSDQAFDLDGLNTVADLLVGEFITTNALTKTIAQIETPSGSVSMCTLSGVNTNLTDDLRSWFKITHAVSNIGGTTALLGSAESASSFGSTDIAALAADDGDDALDINLTGITSKTINWKYKLSVWKTS